MQIENHTFPNFGYLLSKLPNYALVELAESVDEIRKSPKHFQNYSDRLVASTKDAYDLIHKKSVLEPLVNQLIAEYDKNFPGYLYGLDLVSKRSPIGITDLWVNFQHPGDINPNHCHPGIFSFVIWMFSPFNFEEQQKGLPGAKVKGSFEFSYLQSTGQMNRISIPVDNAWNGKICFFPSSLTHCVYPFSSNNNEVRISLSGNVKFLV